MVIYRCWEQIYSISACKYEDIWNLRSEYARVCGMIINSNGKYIFTVNQIKINFQLGLSIWFTTEKAPSSLYWFWTSCIWAKCFKVCICGPTLAWTPSRHPVLRNPISAHPWDLSSVTDVPVFSPSLCQPWLLDLMWGMTCHFQFVCWGLGCWQNLPLSSSADRLTQIQWEDVPGGQVVILSWVVHSSHLVLPCWGTPVLKLWTTIRTSLLKLVFCILRSNRWRKSLPAFRIVLSSNRLGNLYFYPIASAWAMVLWCTTMY